MRRGLRGPLQDALLVALAFAPVSCGETALAFRPGEMQLVAELTDYRVTTNVQSVRAGETKIGVRNRGSQPHDLIVLRTDLEPDKLPYDAGRAQAGEPGLVGKTTELRAGGTAALTVALEPGHYVLICNVAGHYGLGMRTPFTVE